MNTDENQKMWIEKIHENLLLRGRSENTFINYKSALNSFFKYFDKETNFKSLNEEAILPYLKDYFIKQNRSKYTYNAALSSIKLFYSVCIGKSLNPLLLPASKTPKKLPAILPRDKFILIFNGEKYLKHKCWLLLAFCSGLRVEEVAKIRIENISPNEHKLKVLGKGNKERYTILPDIVIKFLRLYCKEKNIKQGYLFSGTNNKECMNKQTIINYFTIIKDIYNLDNNISFHSLRHSFATYYLMNGGDLLTLKSMLGHKSLNATSIYVHLAHDFNNLKGVKYAR